MHANEIVPQEALDYEEIFRRGGGNIAQEDFSLLKCPQCNFVYLYEGEVPTIYLDGTDLTNRKFDDYEQDFSCINCSNLFPKSYLGLEFQVRWADLKASNWDWVIKRDWLIERIPESGSH